MKIARETIVLFCVTLFFWMPRAVEAQTVAFPDPKLEAAVRAALRLPTGPITRANMQTLTNFSARFFSITNLSGLEWATNLNTLDLSRNLIRDLTPLSTLTRLTNFNAGGNLIADLNPLTTLTRLDSLWLFGNPLAGLDPTTNCTRLTTLVAYSCGLNDARPLTTLTNLRYLELRWNPLTNVPSALSGLTNLTTLYLGGIAISNVTFLQNLRRLTFLNLDHGQVKDLSPIATLPALSNLDASYNPLTNAFTTASFANLSGLYLSGNSISNAAVLTNAAGLSSLILCDNRITDIAPLSELTNLRTLDLSRNPIASYTPVTGLTNLSGLWLEGNSISNLAFLQGLASLKALGLRKNNVADLNALSGLTNLLAIVCDFNRLSNISGLDGMLHLFRVHLTGNVLDLSADSPAMTTIETLGGLGAGVSYLPQNSAPALTLPYSWNIAANATSSLAFQVVDETTPGSDLTITVNSSNSGLIPNQSISTTVFGINGLLSVTPATNQTGTATLTVTVTDQSGTSTNAAIIVNVVVPQTVTIPDANLRTAVRQELNKPTGNLTSLDLEKLNQIVILDNTVTTLSGLEWATNLSVLVMKHTLTTNITAVQNLRRMTYMELKDNGATDFSSLTGLTNLSGLSLEGDAITNLSFLQNLTRLVYLSLEQNQIVNFATLGLLTNLDYLSLKENLATNLGAVPNLPRLTFLDVRRNVLDISPGSSSLALIQGMLNRGVVVNYLPQRGPPDFDAPKVWTMETSGKSTLYFNVDPNGFTDSLAFGAKSSNTNLLPDAGLSIGNYGEGWWTLSLAPVTNLNGISTVTLSATNDLGFSNRWDITVTVTPALPFDGQIVNSSLIWQTSPNAPWSGQSFISHDGVQAGESGSVEDGEQSWIQATFQGLGKLSFWWRVSSETNEDYLEFYVDGTLSPPRLSGEVDWQQRQLFISTAGTHTVRWQYTKDFRCCSDGEDAAWLDQVTFVPGPWLEVAASGPTNGQCPLILHTLTNRMYEIQFSSNIVNWTRLTLFMPTNNPTVLMDPSANFGRRFYRLREYP